MTRTASLHPFPILPRITAYSRRPVTLRDIDAGVRIAHAPRVGRIAHALTTRPARAARSRLMRLRMGRAQWRGVTWLSRRAGWPLTEGATLALLALAALSLALAIIALADAGSLPA